MTTSSGKAASKGRQTGDTYELKGHCLVEYPDGTVVTASRNLTLTQAGRYKVTYNDTEKHGGPVTFTVKAAAVTSKVTDAEG